ncbi:hypothetical protein P5673_001748 [Acropora cervicornis]|uniref:Uncharacterized protein n=1 Tax=Acropora cervicornis TaxID=6130 RepID=A0AAD9VFP7_ACRCE|nr:hypothetical protein P5673_001748 [Acropora cervicornis]
MEGGSFIFLAMLAVTIGSRASALKVGEFANLQSATGSEGVQSHIRCFKTIPNCASCLDHRTCLRCQKGFAFLESYWGALCVVKCPEGFTEVATSGNGTMCKSRKGCSKIVNCSQCEETFGDSCDVCEKGFLLFQQKTGSGVHCLTSCPAGFMEHGTRCRAEKCEDFFCSRCKEGLILQNKGGNNCLEKCPSGFFRKLDLLSGQAYCESEYHEMIPRETAAVEVARNAEIPTTVMFAMTDLSCSKALSLSAYAVVQLVTRLVNVILQEILALKGARTAVNHVPVAESANSVSQVSSKLSVEEESHASGAVLEITWREKIQKGKKFA